MMKPIGIIAGDPNSINSEIIGKMWKQKSTFKNIPLEVKARKAKLVAFISNSYFK